MPDVEKAIKGLEACTGEENDCAGHTCPYWDYDYDAGCRIRMELDALALLKDREPVRCQDCKYWDKLVLNRDGDGVCRADNTILVTHPGWFCADGERRTDDA